MALSRRSSPSRARPPDRDGLRAGARPRRSRSSRPRLPAVHRGACAEARRRPWRRSSIELVGFGVTIVRWSRAGSPTAGGRPAWSTWTIFSLGLALIGTFIHATYREPADPLDSYRNAQALIRELIGLSDNLHRGLEPVTLAADDRQRGARRAAGARTGRARTSRRAAHPHHQRPHGTERRGAGGRGAGRPCVPAPDDPRRRARLRAAAGQRRRHRRGRHGVPLPRARPRRPGPAHHPRPTWPPASSPTSCTSTRPSSSPRSATPRPSRNVGAWPARCTTGWPRRWPRWAISSTT